MHLTKVKPCVEVSKASWKASFAGLPMSASEEGRRGARSMELLASAGSIQPGTTCEKQINVGSLSVRRSHVNGRQVLPKPLNLQTSAETKTNLLIERSPSLNILTLRLHLLVSHSQSLPNGQQHKAHKQHADRV